VAQRETEIGWLRASVPKVPGTRQNFEAPNKRKQASWREAAQLRGQAGWAVMPGLAFPAAALAFRRAVCGRMSTHSQIS